MLFHGNQHPAAAARGGAPAGQLGPPAKGMCTGSSDREASLVTAFSMRGNADA